MSVHGREHSFRMKLGGTAEVYNTPVLSIKLIGRDFFMISPAVILKLWHIMTEKSRPQNLIFRRLQIVFRSCRHLARFRKERKQNGQNNTLQNLS